MKTLIKKYFQSQLNPDEFSRVSTFLSNKEKDEEISDLIKPYWENQIDRESTMPRPNIALLGRIKESILETEGALARKKLKIFMFSTGIAAMLAISLFVSTLVFYKKSAQLGYSGTMQELTAPYGARSSFSLPDGSKVYLNSGTTLSFASSFSKDRRVTLKGEAFFEVTKNGNPFIVATKYGQIKVMGTKFNVKAFENEGFSTTLTSGSVNVTDNITGETVVLSPGEQANITNNQVKVIKVDTELYTSWKEGKLILRHEYLRDIVEKLERWYNVKIELSADPHLNSIWFTGTLEMETFSEVLNLLKVTAPINYTYNEKTRTIKLTYQPQKKEPMQ